MPTPAKVTWLVLNIDILVTHSKESWGQTHTSNWLGPLFSDGSVNLSELLSYGISTTFPGTVIRTEDTKLNTTMSQLSISLLGAGR
jgi:hypothetical protein